MARYHKSSLQKLKGVHPDLVAVAQRAAEISALNWQISWGLRTLEQQRELVDSGNSWTMRSRHITGHAVDVFATNADASIAYWQAHHYPAIADAFKQAARELGVAIVWGGDWPNHRDVYHFELDRSVYPADDPADDEGIDEPDFILRFGMVGPLVRTAQILLKGAGYPVSIDGDFGPQTRRMVLDLQLTHGLEITGEIDAETLSKLNELNEDL